MIRINFVCYIIFQERCFKFTREKYLYKRIIREETYQKYFFSNSNGVCENNNPRGCKQKLSSNISIPFEVRTHVETMECASIYTVYCKVAHPFGIKCAKT